MIWVWAESGPDAVLESSLTPPNIVSEVDDEEGIKAGLVVPLTLAHRDMGYSWETLTENVMVSAVVRFFLIRTLSARPLVYDPLLTILPERGSWRRNVRRLLPRLKTRQGNSVRDSCG